MKKLFYALPGLVLLGSAAFANSDSSPAAKACSRLTPESTRDACYKLIQDSPFDSTAVAICDRMQSSHDTLDCMETVQGGTYTSPTAVNACGKSSTPTLTTECLDEVADAGFQEAAVNICSKADPSLIGKCMEAIANREFTPKELRQCQSQSSSESMIQCLTSSGQDDADEKKFRENQKKWQDWVKAKGEPQEHSKMTKNSLLQMIQEHAGETLKCTPQTQNSNSKLQVDIEKMQMTVYHCEYIKK